MFISLAKDQAAVIRQKLLETLGSETDRAVRNKISDAIAEVARQYTDNSVSHAWCFSCQAVY
jgi:importin-5